jgi:uncharacterized protein
LNIRVSNIPEEGLKLRFALEGNWFREFVRDNDRLDFHLHPVDVTCEAVKINETVNLDVELETAIDLECCRCLEPSTTPVKNRIKCTLIPGRDDEEKDAESEVEDIDFSFYRGDVIDLALIVFEQIMLQLPIKALCSDSCRGLCPHCGANLNISICSCRTDAIDARLAALKKFKVKNTKKQ